MYNVTVIRIRTSSFHVEKLLFADLWKSVIRQCYRLDQIDVQLVDNPPGAAALEKATVIEKDLDSIRQNVRFRVTSG